MTLEEAVEHVLADRRLVTCPNGDESGSHQTPCTLCKGYTVVLNPVLAEARTLLGLPLPERPTQMWLTRDTWDDIVSPVKP